MHRCWSRQNFGRWHGFFPNFPNFPEKLCTTFAWKVSRTKTINASFWCGLPMKVFMRFSANVGRFFWNQTSFGAIFGRNFRDFAHILKDFARIFDKSNFSGCTYTPAPPASTPLSSHPHTTEYSLRTHGANYKHTDEWKNTTIGICW